MSFTWADEKYGKLELLTYVNQEVETRLEQAFVVCQISFHESIARMTTYLKGYGVRVYYGGTYRFYVTMCVTYLSYFIISIEDPDVYHNPNKDCAFEFKAAKVNNAVLSTAHRLKREKDRRKNKATNKIDLERKMATRNIRKKKILQNHFL